MKEEKINKYSEIFKALGHPVRLKIVSWLIGGDECNVNNLVEYLNIPQSSTSQHLSVLKHSGVIDYKKKGVCTCYRITDPFVKEIVKKLNQIT